MTCVLPVLSLKILGVISHGGGEARRVQHSFLTTAAGIIFSYLLLGGVTIALKELGMSFGWGVQFQEPLFLSFLIVLLTLFAANMWGLFEIQLPRFLVDTFDQAYHPKLAGDFATGAFATLLATPCTAPFLGTALGFALASGPRDIALIFLGLGIGMALPYLAIAAWPRFATALPRPGMWMLKLKYFLGFALAATAGWLVWVLASQIGLIFSLVMGGMMLALVGLFLMARTIRPVPFLQGFVLLAVAGALGLALIAPRALPPTVENGGPWTAFNEAELAKDVAAGKVVFVDVTADWCLTCKANKQFILAQKDIQKKLFQSDVVAMRADWTNPDSVIASFLHVHGRYGIPFNAVFGPSAPEGIVLPELLTSSAVTDALEKAR